MKQPMFSRKEISSLDGWKEEFTKTAHKKDYSEKMIVHTWFAVIRREELVGTRGRCQSTGGGDASMLRILGSFCECRRLRMIVGVKKNGLRIKTVKKCPCLKCNVIKQTLWKSIVGEKSEEAKSPGGEKAMSPEGKEAKSTEGEEVKSPGEGTVRTGLWARREKRRF